MLPALVAPMLATPGPLPDEPGWAFEVKFDGARCIVGADSGRWSALSRAGRPLGSRFPELAAVTVPGRAVVVDGELVAPGQDGTPDFGLLQTRLSATRRRLGAPPVLLMAFDLLHLDGQDLTGHPYRERRALLDSLDWNAGAMQVPPAWENREAALTFVREHRLEGLVAKRLDAPYTPGVRSRAWIKHKITSRSAAVVVGWRPDRVGVARSLLVATVGDGHLQYAGLVGSGISARAGSQLAALLEPLETSAPTVPVPHGVGARWVRPEVMAEIEHLGRTRAGRLRHPVFRRLLRPGAG